MNVITFSTVTNNLETESQGSILIIPKPLQICFQTYSTYFCLTTYCLSFLLLPSGHFLGFASKMHYTFLASLTHTQPIIASKFHYPNNNKWSV
jgi:hypothetical protein